MINMKGIRYSDEDDFNEIHDKINILVLGNYEKLSKFFLKYFLSGSLKAEIKSMKITGEPRICRIAFPDAVLSLTLNVETAIPKLERELLIKIAIEIKSHIKSFGETLRQLQIYKDCIGSSNYHEVKRKLGITLKNDYSMFVFLVTPDHRFDDAFKSQGFEVLDPSFFGDFSEKTGNQKNLDNF
ncbi:MAG: hypothetical protein ACP5F1_04115 [Thermoplasmata archaeon]